MKDSWIEVSLAVPTPLADPLAEVLVELSGTGVSIENLTVDTFSVDTIEESSMKTLKAYFPAGTSHEYIREAIKTCLSDNAHICPDFTLPSVQITTLREEDWANNWKQHFKPSHIGECLVMKPTWEPYQPREQEIVIELDPGQAFGTGTHATTRLCLEAIEKIFLRRPPFDQNVSAAPHDVLDVGTGSGVLTIAAAKLGAGKIQAIDIDADAVAVAHGNIILNGVGLHVNVSATLLHDVPGTFDAVVANIIAEELVKLADDLVTRVRRSGFLILSGILTEREQFVVEGFSTFPLILKEVTRREEWSCLVYAKDPTG